MGGTPWFANQAAHRLISMWHAKLAQSRFHAVAFESSHNMTLADVDGVGMSVFGHHGVTSDRSGAALWRRSKWLQVSCGVPYSLDMQAAAPVGAQYAVAVAKKVQDTTKQAGAQALQLIEASAVALKPAESGNIGTQLNLMA